MSYRSTATFRFTVDMLSRSRGAMRPSYAGTLSLREQRAQGMPGARCTRGLVRKRKLRVHARAYRLSGGTRHPLRDGFTAYAVLSPATNSSCHRRRRLSGCPDPVGSELATAGLAPATGVRTTRFCRTLQRRSSCAPGHRSRGSTRPAISMRTDALASITPRPAFVTTRDRPLLPERDGHEYGPICHFGKSEYFFREGWTLINRTST
jgi:hypothetical protein